VTTEHTTEAPRQPEHPRWLIAAIQDVVDAAGRSAVQPDEDQIRAETLTALRSFDAVLKLQAATPAEAVNAYWLLACGLAWTSLKAAGMLDPQHRANPDTFATVTVVRGDSDEAVDDPDAELTDPHERALLAMGRFIVAIANNHLDTAAAIFDTTRNQPRDHGDLVLGWMLIMLTESTGQAIARHPASQTPPDGRRPS
jgi:hypothetical protein